MVGDFLIYFRSILDVRVWGGVRLANVRKFAIFIYEIFGHSSQWVWYLGYDVSFVRSNCNAGVFSQV